MAVPFKDLQSRFPTKKTPCIMLEEGAEKLRRRICLWETRPIPFGEEAGVKLVLFSWWKFNVSRANYIRGRRSGHYSCITEPLDVI